MKMTLQEDIIIPAIQWLRDKVEKANQELMRKMSDGKLSNSDAERVKATIDRAKEEISKGSDASIKTIKNTGDWLANWYGETTKGQSVGSQIFDKIGKATGADKIMPGLSSQGAGAVLVAGGALATILLMASYKIYKNKYSEAAQACSKFKGDEKDDCMRKFKMQAVQKQLQELRESIHKCDKSKDPDLCREKINEKIIKLRKKLMDMSRRN